MFKNIKKFIFLGTALVASTAALAGCSGIEKERGQLNEAVLNVLNSSSVVQEQVDADFDKFSFLCADFEKAFDDSFVTVISGVAKYNDGKESGFVRLGYRLSENYFEGIESNKKGEILEALVKAIGEVEVHDFELTPLKSVKTFNKTMEKVAPQKKGSYSYHKGKVFDLGNLIIDREESCATFSVRSYDEYSTDEVYYDVALQMPMTRTEYDDALHEYKVRVELTEEEIAEITENKALIFEKFAEYVKNGEKSKYSIRTSDVKLENYDVKGFKDLNYDREFE